MISKYPTFISNICLAFKMRNALGKALPFKPKRCKLHYVRAHPYPMILQRILGILVLLAATCFMLWLAISVYLALQGPNFSDVGVSMHSNQAVAVLAGLACLLGGIGLATWAMKATLLEDTPALAWGLGIGLGLVAAVLFGIGASWG